jgi:hypothetical protein
VKEDTVMLRILVGAGIVALAIWPASAEPVERHIVDDHTVGCRDQKMAQDAARYTAQGDMDGVLREMGLALASGDCFGFKKGDSVYVTEVATADGLLQVQPHGSTKNYWIRAAAVSTGT